MSVLWTFPGKLGDALLEWPVARHWSKLMGRRFEVGLSEMTEPLKPLFACQENVRHVKVFRDRIKDFSVGGQPSDFKFTKADYKEWDQVFHAGMLAFPNSQITEFTAKCLRIPHDADDFREPSIVLPGTNQFDLNPGRVLLHGKKLSNQGGDPRFWAFAGRLVRSGTLARYFPEIQVIGTDEEIRDARSRLGVNSYFTDGGDWLKLAYYIKASGLVIDAGSGIAPLAGALGVPCIRIHDDINGLNHDIWSNQPTPHQLNVGLKMGDPEVHAYLEELHDARRTDRPTDDREPEDLAPPGLDTPSVDISGAVEGADFAGRVPAEVGPDR